MPTNRGIVLLGVPLASMIHGQGRSSLSQREMYLGTRIEQDPIVQILQRDSIRFDTTAKGGLPRTVLEREDRAPNAVPVWPQRGGDERIPNNPSHRPRTPNNDQPSTHISAAKAIN
jgi:hypothetical protein